MNLYTWVQQYIFKIFKHNHGYGTYVWCIYKITLLNVTSITPVYMYTWFWSHTRQQCLTSIGNEFSNSSISSTVFTPQCLATWQHSIITSGDLHKLKQSKHFTQFSCSSTILSWELTSTEIHTPNSVHFPYHRFLDGYSIVWNPSSVDTLGTHSGRPTQNVLIRGASLFQGLLNVIVTQEENDKKMNVQGEWCIITSVGSTFIPVVIVRASLLTRSMGRVDSGARPWDERAPLIHCTAEHSSENDKRHRSQHKVELYGCSHLSARQEASLLWKVEHCLAIPPVAENTRGVKVECSTSRIRCS